jgi:hypothetical protein
MNLCVIVNSCKDYYETTIPILLDSAKTAGIPFSRIFIVVGEMNDAGGSSATSPIRSTDRFVTSDGVSLIFCPYVNIDYNAAIYFTQTNIGLQTLSQYTHFFYVHDTVEFMEGFWGTMLDHATRCTSFIKSVPMYTQNIGLINVQWFLENKKNMFAAFMNTDLSWKANYKASEYKNGEIIRQIFRGLPPEYLGEDAMFWFDEKGNPVGEYFQGAADEHYIIQKYSGEARNAAVYNTMRVIKYGITCIAGYKMVP